MEPFLPIAFEILSFGAIVVLVVLGLGIIANLMGIFNFAQGEFVLLGAYMTYLAYSIGLPVWLGMLAAPLVVGAFGFLLGLRFLIQGFIAVMLGGIGSFAGPVAGASVIGVASAALPWVMQPVVADILVFILAIVFIKFRPQGLVSSKGG